VLVDPVWGRRVSPSPVFGPTRLHPVPVPLTELPPVDAILISHDHYDHLDLPTVRALLRSQDAPFVVPLGIGVHLRTWGVPDERIVELDWNGSTRFGALTLTCTEARHFSGRFFARDTTLWASWVIAGPRHRVFFGGDTGYTPVFAEIGARLGPFDLTLLPIGAYNDAWHAIHMDPEEAVRAHGDLGGRVLLPIHWATFNLAFHRWAEPVERLLDAARRKDAEVVVPLPGQRIDVDDPPPLFDWWSAVGSAVDEDAGTGGVGASVLARAAALLTLRRDID
jgi:L-ascorbate metabolism protein UlaG (beta-lactamase superfamily)